jgi:uncharacterized membrane-anchored protein
MTSIQKFYLASFIGDQFMNIKSNNDQQVTMLNKVPEVTIFFWLVKMMSTTVGETAADFLTYNLHMGLAITTAITGVLFLGTLFLQLKSNVIA